MTSSFILTMIAGIPGLIIAMVVHEYAHAQIAVKLGDPTPQLMGRTTLNPLAHLDPLGLIMLLVVQFGWAKPVEINPMNFKNPRRDDMLVSVAGPLANLITGFLATAFIVGLFYWEKGHLSEGTHLVLSLIVLYNINFAIFNLIPVPPLDGSHILLRILPTNLAYRFARIAYNPMVSWGILIVFLMTPIPAYILRPMTQWIIQMYSSVLAILF